MTFDLRCVSARALLACALALCGAAGSFAADRRELQFSDLEGWWSAEPTFAGESSRVLLHFIREQDKQIARLSLLDIGAFDFPIGEVTFKGDSIDTHPSSFPLRYDSDKQTLSGHLPDGLAPVYNIAVEFKRTEAVRAPEPPSWHFPSPQVRWTVQLPSAVWAGLELDRKTGTLFVGDDSGTLHALDQQGARRWTFAAGAAIKARPSVIGDSVYVVSDAGLLHRLDKRDGTERWRAKIDQGSPPRIAPTQKGTRWDRYGSAVTTDGKHLYVASRDQHLYAIELDSGRERWRIASDDLATATPAVRGNVVVFASFDGKVRAVDAADGKMRWTYDARLPVSGDVVIAEDRVLVGSRTYDLIALDVRDGRELWKHYYWFSWIESPPVVHDGVVYTGSSDATGVYAIDLESGARLWKASVPGWAWARAAVNADSVVVGTVGQGAYPGTRAGALVGIDRANGRVRWIYLQPPHEELVKTNAEWGFAAAPLMDGDTVYAADLQGRVIAIHAAELRSATER